MQQIEYAPSGETTSQQLRQVLEHAQESMREAVMNGNGERLIELDGQVRSLRNRIFAATLTETRNGIDSAEAAKVSIAKQIEQLRAVKKARNLQLGRAQDLFNARAAKVQKAELSIQMAESNLTTARISCRELKARLENLLKAKLTEQEKLYEQYRN
jgi:chromosome segregation ATPase